MGRQPNSGDTLPTHIYTLNIHCSRNGSTTNNEIGAEAEGRSRRVEILRSHSAVRVSVEPGVETAAYPIPR
jgi:hypothetical protein